MTLILPRVVGVFSRKLWPLFKPALYPADLNLLRKISDTQKGFEDAFKAAKRAAAPLNPKTPHRRPNAQFVSVILL